MGGWRILSPGSYLMNFKGRRRYINWSAPTQAEELILFWHLASDCNFLSQRNIYFPPLELKGSVFLFLKKVMWAISELPPVKCHMKRIQLSYFCLQSRLLCYQEQMDKPYWDPIVFWNQWSDTCLFLSSCRKLEMVCRCIYMFIDQIWIKTNAAAAGQLSWAPWQIKEQKMEISDLAGYHY